MNQEFYKVMNGGVICDIASDSAHLLPGLLMPKGNVFKIALEDEDKAVVLAHDIAEQIERDIQYPGQVKVVVIRETRAEGLAK